jgi:hypothetical protein
MPIVLDGKGLEPSLPDSTGGFVPAMMATGVRCKQPVHPSAEIRRLPRSQHDVKVVRHQTGCQHVYRQQQLRPVDQGQKAVEVTWLVKDGRTVIAA